MPDTRQSLPLPDAASRLRALSDYTTTLLVEAGAGSGKTALLAGRVALMLTHGIRSREVVAITFTEAAAAELLERIERFVAALAAGTVPRELQLALPSGLSAGQAAAITRAKAVLDEITCTTIHGFCQQLIHPYPIEAGIDPGATIIDPAAADLAYQELMQAWLSARFGREGDDAGLGRIPRIEAPGGEDDFFAELIAVASDGAVKLISATAAFLRKKRTARAVAATLDLASSHSFHRQYAGSPLGMPAVASPNRRPPKPSPISANSDKYSMKRLGRPSPGGPSPGFCCTTPLAAATRRNRASTNGGKRASGSVPRATPGSAGRVAPSWREN